MASELRVNTLKDGSGNNSIALSSVATGTAKVIITFDGDSATVRRSQNVSSLTDDATGRFSINQTSAFNDLHAVVVAGNGDHAVHNAGANTNEVQTTSQYKHNHWENNAEVDCTDMNNAAFGDLA